MTVRSCKRSYSTIQSCKRSRPPSLDMVRSSSLIRCSGALSAIRWCNRRLPSLAPRKGRSVVSVDYIWTGRSVHDTSSINLGQFGLGFGLILGPIRIRIELGFWLPLVLHLESILNPICSQFESF